MKYADGSVYNGQWVDNQVCDFKPLKTFLFAVLL